MNNEYPAEQRIWKWKNNARYYIVRLQRDVFNEWALILEWGGRCNKLGHSKLESYSDLEIAFKRLHSIKKRRERRGYTFFS
jgi:predicted DNA-binding WGR domain protein